MSRTLSAITWVPIMLMWIWFATHGVPRWVCWAFAVSSGIALGLTITRRSAEPAERTDR
jgi:hypothetical protein